MICFSFTKNISSISAETQLKKYFSLLVIKDFRNFSPLLCLSFHFQCQSAWVVSIFCYCCFLISLRRSSLCIFFSFRQIFDIVMRKIMNETTMTTSRSRAERTRERRKLFRTFASAFTSLSNKIFFLSTVAQATSFSVWMTHVSH